MKGLISFLVFLLYFSQPTFADGCESLYLSTNQGVLAFISSILTFTINFIICLSPFFILIFAVMVASVIIISLKKSIK